MSLLSPISIFLRNKIIKQHPYLSCCASCGEIAVPLGGRLCTSLECSFPVDAVLVAHEPGAAGRLAGLLQEIPDALPWIKNIFVITAQDITKFNPQEKKSSNIADKFSFKHDCPAASLHELNEISEHYIILTADFHPKNKLNPLELFTTNGIPFLLLQNADGNKYKLAPDIFPQTKSNSTAFLLDANFAGTASSAEYFERMGRWAFQAGKAVPSAYPGKYLDKDSLL